MNQTRNKQTKKGRIYLWCTMVYQVLDHVSHCATYPTSTLLGCVMARLNLRVPRVTHNDLLIWLMFDGRTIGSSVFAPFLVLSLASMDGRTTTNQHSPHFLQVTTLDGNIRTDQRLIFSQNVPYNSAQMGRIVTRSGEKVEVNIPTVAKTYSYLLYTPCSNGRSATT